MIKDFLARRSRKFLLSVGDDGGVLVYMSGGQVEGRFFFNSFDAPELQKVFMGDTEAPIYVLVDVSDQSYLQHAMPPVSAMNVQNMVRRRLEKEFDRTDIKGALLINRNKEGRKDWNYLFVSIRNAPPFSDWMEMLSNLPNPVAGVYLLPVETEPLIKTIKKSIEPENISKPAEWQMLVTHNKTGGLRQVVYRGGHILFTRMAQPVGGNAPGVIAGHVEQETINTMEYIRRMNFDEKAGLDVFIITAAEVKKQLESTKLGVANVYVLTPHEVAGQLGLERATEPRDRFADIVILAQFARSKKAVLKLSTPILDKTRKVLMALKALRGLPYVLVPVAVLLTLWNIYTSFSVSSQTSDALKELNRVQAEQRSLKQRSDAQAAQRVEVEAMVGIYDRLLQSAVVPFGFLSKLSELKVPAALYNDIRFNVVDTSDPKTKKATTNFAFSATIEYPNQSESPQNYIKDVNAFAQKMQEAFQGFDVSFSGLPGQSDFKMLVAGGPEAADTKDLVPVAAPTKESKLGLSMKGVINDEARQAYFTLPDSTRKPAEVAPKPSVPLKIENKPIPVPPVHPVPAPKAGMP